MNNLEQPITRPIKKIVEENPLVRTFYFELDLKARPGQFVMFWLPGVNQKPFGVSFQKNRITGITICKVGPTTEKIFQLKKGDYVGLQGPYGTFFKPGSAKKIILVAGGYGAAPLSFLADTLKGREVHFIIGAQNKKRLLFEKRIKSAGAILHQCTDDGSLGFAGFSTDKLKLLLKEIKADLVCACGPELMQNKIIEICGQANIPAQISLERYIKCGFGLCGQCVVDPLGLRMCQEGPVLTAEIVKKITEFGRYHRDASGQKIYFKKS